MICAPLGSWNQLIAVPGAQSCSTPGCGMRGIERAVLRLN